MLVLDGSDLDRAVEGAIKAKFRNAGQTCVCTNRLLVQAGIYDRLVEPFSARVAALKVAPGTESGAEQIPMINAAALAKLEAFIADAAAKRGTIATGGKRHERGGLFFQTRTRAGRCRGGRQAVRRRCR